MKVRMMEQRDCREIATAFQEQGWHKTVEQYESYFKEQLENKRLVLIAEISGEFAGYVTLVYQSEYPHFKENKIMEIMDFNVLLKFQCQGVGTALMNEVERIVSLSSNEVGLRVGLTGDYGKAQNLYIKRGYQFDQKGLSYHHQYCDYNEKVVVDDNLTLGLTKKLNKE